tara:strand:- start:1887 stop:3290 length:1404 start_codon:yes stop_codon:yes gene_type:complete
LFLDVIPNDLFKPLASKNARLYAIGLYALYNRLIANQSEGDECTPKEAKNTIRYELYNYAQELDWSQEEDSLDLDDDTDIASRIYNRLKNTGWLIEMDDIGYRRITSFPHISAQLLIAFAKIGDQGELDIGSVCQGVMNSLQQAIKDPSSGSKLITFSAKSANGFYAEALALSFTTRELAYRMMNQSNSSEQLSTFFDEFINKVFARDYRTLHSRDNPYRFRSAVLSLVAEIKFDQNIMSKVVEGKKTTQPDLSAEDATAQIVQELDTIFKVFTNIDKLMEGMERYRRSMTKRTKEAIRYSYRSSPDLGRRINDVLIKISGQENNTLFPAPFIEDYYLSPKRAYEQRIPAPEQEATEIKPNYIPVEQIAYDRALKAYFQRRMENPKRLMGYLERHLKQQGSISTDDLAIESLDDLLAYIELRNLIYQNAQSGQSSNHLSSKYKVTPVKNAITQNKYIVAPKLIIERR